MSSNVARVLGIIGLVILCVALSGTIILAAVTVIVF